MEDMKEIVYTRRSTAKITALFDSTAVQTKNDLAAAFEEVERKFEEPGVNLVGLVEEICAGHGLFEVIFSGLRESTFAQLVRALKTQFPETDLFKYQTSLSKRLLHRLGEFFSSLAEYPSEVVETQCRDCSASIVLIHHALDAIYIALGNLAGHLNRSRLDGHRAIVVDDSLFEKLNDECPKTVREAYTTADHLLRSLKTNFAFFLGRLRDDKQLGQIITKQFFVKLPAADAVDGATVRHREGTGAVASFSSKKAALVLDAVEGFGDRRILMSSRMIRNLRKARTKPSLYSSILAALRFVLILYMVYLSKQWVLCRSLSTNELPEAQVDVLATSGSVTIFGAKVPKRRVVVYCEDQAPSLQYQGTDEVLRLFGVYDTSALRVKFLTEFAEHIAARREQAQDSHGIASRATVSPLNGVQGKSAQYADEVSFYLFVIICSTLIKIPQMRSLLTINKFVDLSQNVLQAIQDDEDVFQAFELSPQEQKMLDYTGSCYVLGRSGTGKTSVMVMKMLATECAYAQHPDMMDAKPRQIFVTRSQHLAVKVKETFEETYRAHAPGRRSDAPARSSAQRVLVNDDEERADKHKRFGSLDDIDFPLFVSYDGLCSLIEEELRFACPHWRGPSRDRDAQISYDIFLHQYWPLLNPSTLRGIDPSLVYDQFIGVIKGSEGSLTSPNGCISRDEYVNFSRTATITRSEERHMIYNLFEVYIKHKMTRRQHDIADRTHAILRALVNSSSSSSLRGCVDFLFVDEAQDNLLIDTLLLRLLCGNPDGLFWAGDTAQTVFAGSAFTFNQLKAFMWRTEREIYPTRGVSKDPKFFQLTVNYRSQQGILACAQSVLDCLMAYWPTSIDEVPKEEGLARGQLPIMFVRHEENLLRRLIGKASGSLEFGAEQCIIVRDKTAADHVLNAIEDLAGKAVSRTWQIFTVYESKGQEFNDVLIYNFFEGSECKATQWRRLLRQFCEDNLSFTNDTSESEAKFDAIARELKALYVACTRAKSRLWIIDTSSNIESMQHIWEQREEIDLTRDDLDISEFASASSKSMWERKAEDYFKRAYYSHARKAFYNAGLYHEAAVASAYHLRESAECVFTTIASRARSNAYNKAALAFDEVASATTSIEKYSYYRIAAECLLKIPDEGRAAIAFEKALHYIQALELHRNGGNFERTVQLLRDHEDLEPATVFKVKYASQLFCLINVKLLEALAIFPSEAEVFQFIFRHGLNRAETAMFEYLQDHEEAAKRRIQAGQYAAASRLVRRVKPSRDILSPSDLRSICWRHMSIASIDWGDPKPDDAEMMKVLATLTSSCVTTKMDVEPRRTDLAMFRAIALEDHQALRQLTMVDGVENKFGPLLYLSRVVLLPAQCVGRSGEEIVQWLEDFLPMCCLLRDLCLERNPSHSSPVQLILGFRCVTPVAFRLLPGSAIARFTASKKTPFMESGTTQGHIVSDNVLRGLLTSCLSGALKRRVLEAITTLRSALKVWEKDQQGLTSPRTSLGGLFRMALILDYVRPFDPLPELRKLKHDILTDTHHILMSVAYTDSYHLELCTALDLNRDVRLGIRVIQAWVCESFISLSPKSKNPITELMRLFVISYTLRGASQQYLDDVNAQKTNGTEMDKVRAVLSDMCSGRRVWSPRPLICLLSSVVVRKLPVEVAVLCTTVEFLTGWLSVLCSKRNLGTAAGTVLSVRCLLAHGQGDSDMDQSNKPYLQDCRWLIMSLSSLLRSILNSRAESSGSQSKPSSTAPDRQCLVARICEAMIILGHNIPDSGLREDILKAIISLRGVEKRFPKLYGGYIAAITWSELVAALPKTLQLVKLVESVASSGGKRNYTAVKTTLPLVDRRASKSQPTSQGRRKLGKVTVSKPVEDARYISATATMQTTDLVERISQALDLEVRGRRRLFATIRLQQLFRRVHSLRRPLAHYGTLSFFTNAAFEECMKEVHHISWRHRRLRMIFLGVLPHILACLDAVIMHLEQMKTRAAKNLIQAHHRDLEKLGATVTGIHDDLQAAKVLRDDKLGPRSELYHYQLWTQFYEHVREVPKLIEKLPHNTSRYIKDEWAVVDKCIL
ncbi:hypothetical protein BC835DRAFT_1415776 [Cytidiella melzeri]|nr:hypothetical protein BC835DRAFT_1415776 [Cytidiella melzeri]